MDLKQHLTSKTNGGLIVLLLVVIGLALIDKLTSEAVDAIKWLGASFFLVRTGANISQNMANTNQQTVETPDKEEG